MSSDTVWTDFLFMNTHVHSPSLSLFSLSLFPSYHWGYGKSLNSFPTRTHTHISLFFLLMLEQLVRGECTVMFRNHWFFKMSGYNKYCWLTGKCCTLECSACFYRKYGVEVKVLSVICFSLEGYFRLLLACHRLKTYIIQCCSEWYTCSCAFTLGGDASEFQI